MTEDQVCRLLDSAREKVQVYSGVLKIDPSRSRFLKRLAGYGGANDAASVKKGRGPEDGPATLEPDACVALEILEGVLPPAEGRDPKTILINGIQEITNTLLEDYEINQLLNMILETMYRGFGFHRVFLCLADPRHTHIHARFGFGENIEKIIEGFTFKIQRSPDIFNIALSQGKDLGIDDAEDSRIQAGIPEWYRRLVSARAFVLYPIQVNKKPLGLIYADRDRKGKVLTGDQLHYMKTLCNQAMLAMKQMRLKA